MEEPQLNTYEVKILRGNPPTIDLNTRKIIVFEDHSYKHTHDYEPLPLDRNLRSGNRRAEGRGVNLPDPHFISLVKREFGDDFLKLLRPKDDIKEDSTYLRRRLQHLIFRSKPAQCLLCKLLFCA